MRCLVKGIFSYFHKCEKISLFTRRFVKIILGILHFLKLILNLHSHQNISILHMGFQYSYGMRIFFPTKRSDYPYCHPPLITLCRRTNTSRHPLSPNRHQPPPPSTKDIFENVQNILKNSICLPNALKNTCLEKVFLG